MSRDSSAFKVAIILSVALLLGIPAGSIPPAHATTTPIQFPPWSAFGPRQHSISFKFYFDTQSMLADFDAGLIDITDVPDMTQRLNCVANSNCDQLNPNYFVTNGQAELGEEQIDISHQVSFLGLALQCGRYTLPAAGNPAQCSPGYPPKAPTITANSDTAIACDATHFQLVVHLLNFEENLAVITDANEVITATPAAGTASSVQSPTGTYDLGCLSGLPPGYSVSTAVYGDGGTVMAGVASFAEVRIATSAGGTGPVCVNNKLCDVNFNVDYNSASTREPSVASIHIGRALQHLVDKPNFRNLPVLSGQAVCDDIWGSPSQGIMTSVGDSSTPCASGDPSVEVSHATIVAECAELASSSLPGFSPILPCNPVSLYNLMSDNIHGAPTCGINNLGVEIPTATCFPSQGNQGPFTILAETGYSGLADLTAACDQLLLAGFIIAPLGATCDDVAAGNIVGGETAHLSNNGQQLAYLIRTPGAFPARPRYGQISADELNFLFGTGAPNGGTICYGTLLPTPSPGATCSSTTYPRFYSIGEVGNAIFQAAQTWNLYTGAQAHGSTADVLLYTLHSRFSGSAQSGFTCGGPLADFPNDYDLYCDPIVDTQAFAGEFSPSPTASIAFFRNTATLGDTRGVLVPIFSNVNKYLALDAWNTFGSRSSLVPSFGKGFAAGGPGAWQSFLNMRPNGLVTSGTFQPGGGTPGLIRRSSTSGGILHQNPFTADTGSEADLINQIWDTMLVVNPNTGGSTLQLIDWMTKSHSSSFDPATGLNTQVWNLRNDICWQDSTVGPAGQGCDRPVTSDDVCFSILLQRDGPARNSAAAQGVVSCTAPDPHTVLVVHLGLSAFQDINVGGIYIVPAHLWGTACGWALGPHDTGHEPKSAYNAGVGVIGAPCVQSGFDPMALTFNGVAFSTPLPPNVSGLMVGSGPYMCVRSTDGKVGGSCAVNIGTGALEGQALDVCCVQVETRFPFYMRCCDDTQGSNLEALGWADSNKDGKITIVDASSLSFVFGKSDAYFGHPLYGTAGTVGIGQAAFMANAFDSGTIAPCLSFSCPGPPNEPTPAAPLLGLDLSIDPFQVVLNNGNIVYYMGMIYSASSGTLDGTLVLTALSGSPSPSSFTATIGTTILTGTPDSLHPGNIVFSFIGLGSTRNTVTVSYLGAVILTENT